MRPSVRPEHSPPSSSVPESSTILSWVDLGRVPSPATRDSNTAPVVVGRHLTAASRPRPFTHSPDSTAPVAVSFFPRRTRVGGRRRRSPRGGDAAAAQQGGGVAGPAALRRGEMSVCSEHLVLISARARTRGEQRECSSYPAEKASFPWPERCPRLNRCTRKITMPASGRLVRVPTKTAAGRPCKRLHDPPRVHAPPKTRRAFPCECPSKRPKTPARGVEAARPGPNEPPQTAQTRTIAPRPSLVDCATGGYSLSRKSADARRQPPPP